jgi:hypothetical protein
MSAVVALISAVMLAIVADVYYLYLILSLSLLSLMPVLLMRCLHSEVDAAGHANALETPLLLRSDVIAADIELVQRPIVGGGIS